MTVKTPKEFVDSLYHRWLQENYKAAITLGFSVNPDGSFDVNDAINALSARLGERAVNTFYKEFFERTYPKDNKVMMDSIEAAIFEEIYNDCVDGVQKETY